VTQTDVYTSYATRFTSLPEHSDNTAQADHADLATSDQAAGQGRSQSTEEAERTELEEFEANMADTEISMALEGTGEAVGEVGEDGMEGITTIHDLSQNGSHTFGQHSNTRTSIGTERTLADDQARNGIIDPQVDLDPPGQTPGQTSDSRNRTQTNTGSNGHTHSKQDQHAGQNQAQGEHRTLQESRMLNPVELITLVRMTFPKAETVVDEHGRFVIRGVERREEKRKGKVEMFPFGQSLGESGFAVWV
jgi:hypothetical protein